MRRRPLRCRAVAGARLDTYEGQRRPGARGVVALTDHMTRVATFRSTPARALRNAALPLLSRVPAVRRGLATEPAEPSCR